MPNILRAGVVNQHCCFRSVVKDDRRKKADYPSEQHVGGAIIISDDENSNQSSTSELSQSGAHKKAGQTKIHAICSALGKFGLSFESLYSICRNLKTSEDIWLWILVVHGLLIKTPHCLMFKYGSHLPHCLCSVAQWPVHQVNSKVCRMLYFKGAE